MSAKYTEAIFIRITPALKAALANLLSVSSRDDYPSMGDLLRDILDTETQKRLKKYTESKEDKNVK